MFGWKRTSIIAIFKLHSFLWNRHHCFQGSSVLTDRHAVRQTVSTNDVFMIPSPNQAPDRSRFTAGAVTVTVSPLSGPQRARWLSYWASQRVAPSLLPDSVCLTSVLFALSSPSFTPILLRSNFPSVFPFKKGPGVLMLPIKDSRNSDTVSNKRRSLNAMQAPVDPLQSRISPRPVGAMLVSIKHPLTKHQASGMQFWLDKSGKEELLIYLFLFFVFFSFANFTTSTECPEMTPQEPRCHRVEKIKTMTDY